MIRRLGRKQTEDERLFKPDFLNANGTCNDDKVVGEILGSWKRTSSKLERVPYRSGDELLKYEEEYEIKDNLVLLEENETDAFKEYNKGDVVDVCFHNADNMREEIEECFKEDGFRLISGPSISASYVDGSGKILFKVKYTLR
jgi:hypothetical protein